MASESLNDTMFDVISQEIMDAFEYLIEQLITRRDELLAEVNAKKQGYINTLFVEDENVKELTNIQSQIEQLSIKQNIPSAKIQESLVPLQKQIRNVIEPPNLKFECSYKKLSDQIRKLGSVVLNKTPLSAHYKSKKKAEIILKCTTPTAIHVDETYLYAIGDVYSEYASGLKRLDIFRIQDWSLSEKIPGEDAMEPIVVTTNKEHLYIVYKDTSIYQDEDDIFGTMVDENILTNEDHIYKFSKASRKKLTSINLSKCRNYYHRDVIGIAMSPTDDEIYVLFDRGNKIGIFDANLFYRREISISINPTCIQFKEDRLYLMVRGDIIYQNDRKEGIELGFRKHLKSFDGDYFCFDSVGNIIISDGREVKVVSPDGEKMLEIGQNSQCNEDVRGCSALAVLNDKIVIACRDLDSIKIF